MGVPKDFKVLSPRCHMNNRNDNQTTTIIYTKHQKWGNMNEAMLGIKPIEAGYDHQCSATELQLSQQCSIHVPLLYKYKLVVFIQQLMVILNVYGLIIQISNTDILYHISPTDNMSVHYIHT